ncbi:hypothetical protein GOBAR_DD04926 [Gossypium barbadense]|nr:hypothetical protein GOBAR_DD04926 [Gossypium barbadense]
MEISSSLSSLDDKVTKKVRMRCKDAGEDDHLMVVDDDGNRNGFEKPDKDDLQLLNDDVTKGTDDGLPFIRFSNREESDYIQALTEGPWIIFEQYLKSILMSIGKTIGHVIKLDDDTGNAHTGRFVPMAIFLDLNKPLVSKIKVDGRIQQVEYESLPTFVFRMGVLVI